ncbi:MAG: hypothetical protein M3Q64_01285 [bacterium]|nr:hypothetical protein [bacterium]
MNNEINGNVYLPGLTKLLEQYSCFTKQDWKNIVTIVIVYGFIVLFLYPLWHTKEVKILLFSAAILFSIWLWVLWVIRTHFNT